MAELATIARPYAEALFKAIPAGDKSMVVEQLDELGQVAADAQLQALAASPSATVDAVFGVAAGATRHVLGDAVRNLLRVVLENGRLPAVPEISAQFKALVNAQSGSSDATIHSAFPIDGGALAEVVATLERRFGRRLNAHVVVEPELIGGIRVVVGDEVLDTSVKARLEQMKVALTA